MPSTEKTGLVETFFQAVHNGNLGLIRQCVTKGVDCNRARYGSLKRTALHLATTAGHWRVVRYLTKDCQVDAEAKDNDGGTALHYASKFGAVKMAQYLIEDCHVNPEAKDNDGQTALHYASENGRLPMMRYLIEKCHVDPEAKNNCQKTVLHLASESGCWNVVQYLLGKCLVDKETKDNSERTALYYAIENGHLQIVHALESEVGDHQSTTDEAATTTSTLPIHPATHDPTPTNNATFIRNPSNTTPNTYKVQDKYKRGADLPWYAIAIDSHNCRYKDLRQSRTYRNMRNSNSKYIPLDIFYYKLILRFQQPQYINRYREVISHEDQLLFVYVDVENVFRPIDWKEITEQGAQHLMSSRDIRDYHVSVDIRKNGGQRRRTRKEKIEHLRILILLKQKALDAMEPPSPYKPVIEHMLESINDLIKDDTAENDVEKHDKHIRDAWEHYFPSSNPNKRQRMSCNGPMVPNSSDDLFSESSSDQTLSTVEHPTKPPYPPNYHYYSQYFNQYYGPKYRVPYQGVYQPPMIYQYPYQPPHCIPEPCRLRHSTFIMDDDYATTNIIYTKTPTSDTKSQQEGLVPYHGANQPPTLYQYPYQPPHYISQPCCLRHNTYITDDDHVNNTNVSNINTPTSVMKSQPEGLVPYHGAYQPPTLDQYPYQPPHYIPDPYSLRHNTYITDDDHVNNANVTNTNTPTIVTKSQPEDSNPYMLSLRQILDDEY